jgi:hypothetical protein
MENKTRYLKEQEVAEITGISVQHLRNSRWQSKGIPYVKAGRSIFYALNDVHDFMEAHKIQTQEQGDMK